MIKHFSLLLLIMAFGLAVPHAYGQTVQAAPPAAAAPDNKMLSGTATGSAMSSIAAPNLFNGSMNITVPIYNFNHDNMDYGISLGYNTQGVKVDEFSSIVGLHWGLNCGSSIVRVERDLPDELLQHTDSLIETTMHINGHAVDTFIANKEMHIYGRLFSFVESSAHLNAPNAYADHESDEFIVSLFGASFKFYIGKGLKVFTTSPRNFKVELLADSIPVTNINQLSGTNPPALNFRITDNQGIQYIFQPHTSDAFIGTDKFWDWGQVLKTPDGFPPAFTADYPVSWRLKKVVFADGQAITYKYNLNPGQGGVPYYSSLSYLDYYVREIPGQQYPLTFFGVNQQKDESSEFPWQEIDYPNGVKVNFEYSTTKWNLKGINLLSEIRISSGDNCKRFRLYQDSTGGRYYLDSISQVSCDGSTVEPYYRFTYNPIIGDPAIPHYAKLPDRLDASQDLYGYHNTDFSGVAVDGSGNKITIPKHSPPNATNYGNDRGYAPQYAQAGLLTAVTNAYGGEEYLYYGPNVISAIPLADSIPTDNSFIGASQPDGVRVDSIVSTDPAQPGKKRLTVFSYSGGQLFMPGGYFHYPEEIDSATGTWTQLIYQSMFLTPHQLVNGANHGYSSVDVKNYVDGALLSRRVMTFTNMADATSGNQPRYYKVPGSMDYFQYPYTDKQYLKDWEIGLPLSTTDYDQNNRIIKKVINQYNFSPVDLSAASIIANAKIAKVNSGTGIYINGYADNFYPNKKVFTDNYYPYKGKATLAFTVTQKYITDTRFMTDTTWYNYDDHNNLSSVVTQNSDGGKTATEMIYNYNVDGPQFASGHPGYTAHPGTTLYNMSDSGLEIPVSTERWKLLPGTRITDPYGGTVLQNNNELLSAYITGYQYQGGKLLTKGLWNTQTGSPLSYTGYTGLVSGVAGNPYGKVLNAYNTSNPVEDFIKTSQVVLFDAKDNPQETQLQGQDQYKAMIWDTASGQKLAEAANCHYNDIAYTSFEDNLSESNFTVSYTPGIIAATDAVTGNRVLSLWKAPVQQGDPGSAITITGRQNLQAGKPYIFSFWVSVTGSNPAPTLKVGSQVISLASQVAYTKGSWKKYLVRFTPSAAGKITITGTSAGSRIDELRLFPANAQMQSWTYEPLLGKSSETDESGQILYFKYDTMGRQNAVSDMDGHVLSKTDYHVAY